jgi:S-DNA-T family DNA segregation ATPase FtsK/SpoIIIE
MAQNTYKKNAPRKEPQEVKKKLGGFKKFTGFFSDRRLHLTVGLFLMVASIFLLTAFVSYLFTGRADHSVVESIIQTGLRTSGTETENWLGLLGAWAAYIFMYKWFGISAILLVPVIFAIGSRIVFRKELIPVAPTTTFCVYMAFWLSISMGIIMQQTGLQDEFGFLCGGIGFEIALLTDQMIGWGGFLLSLLSLIVFVIYFFNVTSFPAFSNKLKEEIQDMDNKAAINDEDDNELSEDDEEGLTEDELAIFEEGILLKTLDAAPKAVVPAPVTDAAGASALSSLKPQSATHEFELETKPLPKPPVVKPELSLQIEQPVQDEEDPDLEIAPQVEERFMEEMVNYDPTLELGSYQYPNIDLLNQHSAVNSYQVSNEELQANKDRIVETLSHYGIGIANIKATIGPTVTLYEIVPDAGVRISKIKSLEDDIALSLAALGIRIIAPIPGKGTIGIEVPNKNREMVGMRSVMATEKFMKSSMDLPVVLGKTISNEVFVTDLAKMPHLLMAGATGQGKSVGLNVLLTSLIYRKHPSQLKLVLVDPKKVELSLFSKLERHFLAKLPGEDDAIITDTKKVINTLNSLCIEMDDRYNLLKEAGCRNLKEYNQKFVERKLNPEKGHYFMPYIVLVIDELADLMMTAGKEVETPIARLAQLARAIGIHLVVATQRPSVNVITGIIKANFPARLSFKVTSKVDSRTILDTSGSEQLVGQGDMLLSMGSDLIRLQCAFVDTPEVERVCEFIGSQRGYEMAYQLPEFVGDDGGEGKGDFNPADRDPMFDEAARIIVAHQQGSTSLLQRRLKLGYNRAGRLIDQLESAGIVGPFEGSKARDVLIRDEYSLEQLLNELGK